MKTTDLRPYAVAVLATVYSVAFWVFQTRAPRAEAPAPRSKAIVRAADPPHAPRVVVVRPRIRTRSS